MNTRAGYNAFWNVLGTTLPLFSGIIAIPLLLHGLGNVRLGIFSLAIGLIGFSGLFDLGLGRALTQIVASEKGKGTPFGAIAGLARKALTVLFLVGLCWGIALWVSAPFLVNHLFSLGGSLGQETVIGLRWIALSLPFALTSSGFIGILEGIQRFPLINAIRVPLGTAFFIIPALIGLATPDVGTVIGALAATRLAAFLIWLFTLLRVFNLWASSSIKLHIGPLVRFSGWLTVSNLVGPLMVYADRFYLASLFSPATVALYTVPLDTAFRATSLPLAAVNALFPALAHARGQITQVTSLVKCAGQAMLLLWLPPMLIAMLLAHEVLTLWLNLDFANQATSVFQWILLGVYINGFAHIPYAILQSTGRADITAKLHMLELPLYAGLIIALVEYFGIVGAAIAWTTRIMLDTALLFIMAVKIEPHQANGLYKTTSFAAAGTLALTVTMLIHALIVRWIIVALVVVVAISTLWWFRSYIVLKNKEDICHHAP